MVEEGLNSKDNTNAKAVERTQETGGVEAFRNQVFSDRNNSATRMEESSASNALPTMTLHFGDSAKNNCATTQQPDSGNNDRPGQNLVEKLLKGEKSKIDFGNLKEEDFKPRIDKSKLLAEITKGLKPDDVKTSNEGIQSIEPKDLKASGDTSKNDKNVKEDSVQEFFMKELDGGMDLAGLQGKDFRPKDGVQKLPTGDHIVRQDGRETLFTPNGDQVVVNPNGSHEIKGNIRSEKTDEKGVTTVTFGDGSTVQLDKQGIRNVSRDGQTSTVRSDSPAPFPKLPPSTLPPGWPVDLPGAREPWLPPDPRLPWPDSRMLLDQAQKGKV